MSISYPAVTVTLIGNLKQGEFREAPLQKMPALFGHCPIFTAYVPPNHPGKGLDSPKIKQMSV